MHHKVSNLLILLIFTPNIIYGMENVLIGRMKGEFLNATMACDDGWLLIPGQGCFLFDLDNKMFWMEAQVHCEKMGGYLPENLDSELEEILIEYTLLIGGGDTTDIWLGATDIGDEGTWIWIHSDTKVSEPFWKNGQPSCGFDCNCLALAISTIDEFSGWFDAHCDHNYERTVVCQKPSVEGLN